MSIPRRLVVWCASDAGTGKGGSLGKEFLELLKQCIGDNPPNYGNADSGLGLLYEHFRGNNSYDNEQIRVDFNELYQQMNGMSLREMDRIIYQVYKFCRDHEKEGFAEEIQIGFIMRYEAE